MVWNTPLCLIIFGPNKEKCRRRKACRFTFLVIFGPNNRDLQSHLNSAHQHKSWLAHVGEVVIAMGREVGHVNE